MANLPRLRPQLQGNEHATSVIAFGSRTGYNYPSFNKPLKELIDQILEEDSLGNPEVRVLDNPANVEDVAQALKSPKPTKLIMWRPLQVFMHNIEWRTLLPFTSVADPKARQLVAAERERRIKQIVAAAESGGNG